MSGGRTVCASHSHGFRGGRDASSEERLDAIVRA